MIKYFVSSLLLLLSAPAFSTPVTFAYTGTLTTSSLSGNGGFGSLVTGTISFDNEIIDSSSGGFFDSYRLDGPGNGGVTFGATFNNGSLSESWVESSVGNNTLSFTDTASADQVIFTVLDPTTFSSFQLYFFDRFNLDLVGLGSGTLTGTPLDLSALLISSISGSFNRVVLRDENFNFIGDANFNLDSISAVPLPTAAWLFLTALGGLFGCKRLKAAA